MDPVKTTIRTYDAHAAAFATGRDPLYWAEEFARFRALLPAGSVLDLGCGYGRDAPLFLAAGYGYLGIDASRELIALARKAVPQAQFEVRDFTHVQLENRFDGLWAVASLLHVPKAELPAVLARVRACLAPGAPGFIAMKEGEGERFVSDDARLSGAPRYFAFYSAAEFAARLEESGFHVLSQHRKDREGKRWLCSFVRA